VVLYHLLKVEEKDVPMRNFVVSGLVIYSIGVMGVELVWYLNRPWPLFFLEIEFMIEEGLEMIGTSLVLVGCLIKLTQEGLIVGRTKIVVD